MRIVQRYGDIEHMAAHHTPRCVIIRGGDEYLNRLAARRHARQWLDAHPDSELIELEAKDSSRYDFEEATSPSLLSPSAAVIVNHAEDCDEPLAQAITDHCRNPHGEADGSLVIVSHNGSAKGKRLIDSLTRLHAVIPHPQRRLAQHEPVPRAVVHAQRQIDPCESMGLDALHPLDADFAQGLARGARARHGEQERNARRTPEKKFMRAHRSAV